MLNSSKLKFYVQSCLSHNFQQQWFCYILILQLEPNPRTVCRLVFFTEKPVQRTSARWMGSGLELDDGGAYPLHNSYGSLALLYIWSLQYNTDITSTCTSTSVPYFPCLVFISWSFNFQFLYHASYTVLNKKQLLPPSNAVCSSYYSMIELIPSCMSFIVSPFWGTYLVLNDWGNTLYFSRK